MSHVYDTKSLAVDEALKMAAVISSKSPVAVIGTKEVLNYSRDHSVEDGKSFFLAPLDHFIIDM